MAEKKSIEELEKLGFHRWQKNGLDRMYINATTLGLECTYYGSGNIKSAYFRGAAISNSEARRMKAAKTYINLVTGKIVSDNDTLAKAAAEISGYEVA